MKPNFRHTVMPILIALFVGVMNLPALNIVRVDRQGMGHEHAQPWRAKTLAAVVDVAMGGWIFFNRLRRRLIQAERSMLFRPAVFAATLLACVVLNWHALYAAPILMGTALTEGQHAGEFVIEEDDAVGRPSRENITVLSGQNLTAGAVIGRVTKGIGRVSIPTVVGGTGTGAASNVYAGPEVQVGSYVLTCTAAVTNGGVFSLTCPDGLVLPTFTMTPGSTTATAYRSRHINFTITDATDFIVGNSFTFVVGTTAPTIIGGTGTATISALALGPDAAPGNYRLYCIEAISNGGRWQMFRGGPDGGASMGEYLMSAGSTNATTFESRVFTFTLTDATDVIVGNYFDVCVFNQLSGGKVVAWDPTTFDGRHKAIGALYDAVDASSADKAGVIVTRDATLRRADLQWATAITSSQKVSAENDLADRLVILR